MQKNEAKQRAAAASNKVRGERSLAKFKACLDAIGAELLEPEWLGARAPHRVRCANGHDCAPMPNNVISGYGPCRTCKGTDPATSFAKFRARLDELGATLLEQTWLGSHVPHRIRCAAGHESSPQPGNVISGGGICPTCANIHKSLTWGTPVWDVFYVVTGAAGIKFGVTGGDPKERLAVHRRDGYADVVRVWTGLCDGLAKATEDTVLARLKCDGWTPVRGVEYFPPGALATVLRIATAVLDTDS